MPLENEILSLMGNLYRNVRAMPLNLGGVSGLNGGIGGPPGGFIGQIPQGRVTYDTTEGISASGIIASGTGNLVDNLNHIRYRLGLLETSSGAGAVGYLNDLLDVTITSPVDNNVLVYSGGGWVNSSLITGGGNVFGNASVTDGHLAVFDVDGYHIKDGGAIPTGGGADVLQVQVFS